MGSEPAVTIAERYSRNELLFGKAGQERLASTRVAIVGVGGLGSHVSQQLAYAGVQSLTLVDPDKVELSNLNRLVGAVPGDVGVEKVNVIRRSVSSVNPDADVSTYADVLNGDTTGAAVAEVDVVFGCVDRD